MKRNISNLLKGVVGVSMSALLWSCSAESPFDNDGVGTVHLRTVVNSVTTRAGDDATDREQQLRDNCVVYISGSNGLIYKEKGLDNVVESLTLKSGHYVAEAWSGDSVTASFDKMFFRGYQPFDVSKGDNSNVVVNCHIKNVVVSINTATINPSLMKDDYVITVKNTRGSLVFDKNNADSARGYFMMPDNDDVLDFTITGTRKDGKPFEKSGKIESVESAHHYIMNFEYNPDYDDSQDKGAVFVKILIKDENLTDTQTVIVPSAPTVAGMEFDIDKQQVFVNDEDIPEELALKICGFGDGFNSIIISSTSASELGIPSQFNIIGLDPEPMAQCKNAGLDWDEHIYKASTNVSTKYVKLSKSLISKLSKDKASEHVISIAVTDKFGQTGNAQIRIARSEGQIVMEDPIVVEPLDADSNPMNLTGTTATLNFSLSEGYDGIPGVEYRKANDTSWTFVSASNIAKSPRKSPMLAPRKYALTITDLEPGTTYQYRACCGDFHSNEVLSFTTESVFVMTNASFEDWSSYSAKTLLGTKNVILPGNTGDKLTSFWGSGNEGSATANMTLTEKSTDMVNSGSYSARLESKSAMGVIAAGNMFVGYYDYTEGTNGVLQLGREYNGSHPAKVRVYANYRPGNKVSVKSGNEEFLDDLKAGGFDQGQIYVALTDEVIEVRTNPKDRKLFDANDPHVLAYGQVTWKEAFGPEGQLQMLEIPFDYNERAKTKRPTHIVIVCSASKFGDYFSGSTGSVMYLDDFELVY